MISPMLFRGAMARFASGITVVTTYDKNQKVGVTISAFASLSLDPPLILFCLDKKSHALSAFTPGKAFAVHVLHDKQKRLAEIFGRRELRNWTHAPYVLGENGVPVLDDVMAVIHCTVDERYPGGDHLIITGAVEHIMLNDKRLRPLLHSQRRYHNLGRAKKPPKR